MPRAERLFFSCFMFLLISCASPRITGFPAGVLPPRGVFAAERFSMIGDMRLRGFADGYYSFALKSSDAGTEFLIIDALGASLRDETAEAIAAEAVAALKGKSGFIKSVKQRGDAIYFRFARNPFHIKKITVFMEEGGPGRIKLYFSKGVADMEISIIAYEEN